MLKKLLPHLEQNFIKTLKMLSSLFGLQVKSIDQKLALAVLIKISTLLNLIETKEEQQRVSSMFKAYKTAFPQSATFSGSDPSRLD